MNCVFASDDIGDGRAVAGLLFRLRLAGGGGFVFWHFDGCEDEKGGCY